MISLIDIGSIDLCVLCVFVVRSTPSLGEMYYQNYNAYKEAIQIKCMQYKIDYHQAIIGSDFNQVLQTFIMKRN